MPFIYLCLAFVLILQADIESRVQQNCVRHTCRACLSTPCSVECYKHARELAPVQRGDVDHITLSGVSYEWLTISRHSVRRQATKVGHEIERYLNRFPDDNEM